MGSLDLFGKIPEMKSCVETDGGGGGGGGRLPICMSIPRLSFIINRSLTDN